MLSGGRNIMYCIPSSASIPSTAIQSSNRHGFTNRTSLNESTIEPRAETPNPPQAEWVESTDQKATAGPQNFAHFTHRGSRIATTIERVMQNDRIE